MHPLKILSKLLKKKQKEEKKKLGPCGCALINQSICRFSDIQNIIYEWSLIFVIQTFTIHFN